MAPVEELVLMDLDRSNKGASKQRRDQINAEINILRDLLPLPESSRQRLSQLQVMSLSCVYIRKCNILQKVFRQRSQEPHLPEALDFFQAMTGFLLVTTREGKLIYISENVTDYLGHSMVDMKTQGDSLYDIIDKRDHRTVQAKLSPGVARDASDVTEDISFFCRMNMSRTLKRQSGFGDVKVMHIQGHFVPMSSSETNCLGEQQYVFMASCSPLMTPDLKENLVLNNTMVFKTVHQLDMAFLEVTKMAEHHLGYTIDELCKSSWYNLIHPEDIHEAKEKHLQLVRSNHHEIGCMMTVRMMKADGSIFWVNIVMHMKQSLLSQTEEPYIVCINQIISAQEAYQIKIQGQMFSMYPSRVQELWGSQMPSMSPTQTYSPNQWIQPDSNGAVPVPSYQCPMPTYTNQSGYPVMYPNTCSSMADLGRKQCGNTLQSGAPLVQTDKLKAMLKRKIQGPSVSTPSCQSPKVPKMSWNVDRRRDRLTFQELEAPQFVTGQNPRVVNQHGQVVQVMLASNQHPPAMFVAKTYKSTPEITSVSNSFKFEQVVPDINVPESYLTPDPSPVSSPEPAKVVKTEVMDPDEVGPKGASAVSILQALEKLASKPQVRGASKLNLSSPAKPQVRVASKLNLSSTAKPAENFFPGSGRLKNKELPIFDAFEIDNFFEMLEVPDDNSKVLCQMENIKFETKREKVSSHLPVSVVKNEEGVSFMSQAHIEASQIVSQVADAGEFLPVKVEVSDADAPCCLQTGGREQAVTGIAATAPLSQETLARCPSLDDLLSCFSDEGMTSSPFEVGSRSPSLDLSVCESTCKEIPPIQKMSSFDSLCQMPVSFGCHQAIEELSPLSNSSCLSREDDMMEKSWNLSMDLESLDAKDEVDTPPSSEMVRHNDLGIDHVFDQVELLLNSFVPSHGCEDM